MSQILESVEILLCTNFILLLKFFLFCWAKCVVENGFSKLFDHRNVKTYCRLFGTLSTLCFAFLSFDPQNRLRVLSPKIYYLLRRAGFLFFVAIFASVSNLSLLAIRVLTDQTYCRFIYNVLLVLLSFSYCVLMAVREVMGLLWTCEEETDLTSQLDGIDVAMDLLEAGILLLSMVVSFYAYCKSYKFCNRLEAMLMDERRRVFREFRKWIIFLGFCCSTLVVVFVTNYQLVLYKKLRILTMDDRILFSIISFAILSLYYSIIYFIF
ncbi:hypothetical protein MHBO_003149 [Bonamia ostreae]|uniref:Gustatory receptor n=1 Tax=Bonamia ostreae TaxID=126728 RepID=A0ABV2AQI8_9EUKA